MDVKLPFTYSLFDTTYDSDFPENKYFMTLFDAIPSKYYSSKSLFHNSIIEHFKKLNFVLDWEIETDPLSYRSNKSMAVLVNREESILLKIRGNLESKIEKKDENVQIEFCYDVNKCNIREKLLEWNLEGFIREKKRSYINLVKSDMGSLDTEEYDIPIPVIDLGLNYGNDFIKIHEIIVNRLNKDKDKGIILLHGDSGTGKTSYLKYLTKFIERKDVLFIPPSMAEMLAEPSIIPFLMEKRNSILVIEDAERVISDRQGGNSSSAGVSNILNLTDGILGDCLNIQIIATFNTQKENIDKALLRKGRLIAEHKFEKLSVEDTNKLLKHLEKDFISDEPLALADIYNIDIDDVRVQKEPSKIGFRF